MLCTGASSRCFVPAGVIAAAHATRTNGTVVHPEKSAT